MMIGNFLITHFGDFNNVYVYVQLSVVQTYLPIRVFLTNETVNVVIDQLVLPC